MINGLKIGVGQYSISKIAAFECEDIGDNIEGEFSPRAI